jgi:dipeptidyl aminopeptidase/acylaminoacyl peptidase
MFVHITGRKVILAAALAVIIALSLTQWLSRESVSDDLSLDYVPLITPTPIPRHVLAADVPLPGGVSSDSVLVMIQGLVERRLVIWPLAGTKPSQEVDHHVNPGLLLPSPGKTHVLYSTDHTIMVLNVAEQRAYVVAELPDKAKLRNAQWSPDGSAIAFVIEVRDHRVSYYTPADGSRAAAVMLRVPQGLPLDVAWLPDGRPVSIFLAVGPVGGLEARYQLFDPVTEDQIILPPDTPIIQPYAPWRSPDGQQQVYTMSSWTAKDFGDTCREGAIGLADAEWLYLTSVGGRGRPLEVAFAIEDVFLYWPAWLADGRVLFWGVTDDACPREDSGLYVARLGSEPRQIVQTYPIYDTDDKDGTLWSASYTPSPDLRLVAWIQNDTDTETSTVYLTPISGGESDPLFQTEPVPAGAPRFAFRDTTMILELAWLP